MNNCKLSQVGDTLWRVRGRAGGRPRRAVGVLLVLLAGLLSASAQSFTIDWFTVDGGGGTSTGGGFELTGTAGQPDAGSMSGGPFSLDGGFWGISALVQAVGSPSLKVTRSGSSLVLSWPSPSTGFHLQQSGTVADQNGNSWSYAIGTVNDDGLTRSVTIAVPFGTVYFRLVKGSAGFGAAYSVVGFPEQRAPQPAQ